MNIAKLIFFNNGNIGAFTEEGVQVPSEQGCAFLDSLQDKLDRDVINEDTQVTMSGWADGTVSDYIKSGRLRAPQKSTNFDRERALWDACNDICSYCAGKASRYNESPEVDPKGNYFHLDTKERKVACAAAAIWARINRDIADTQKG